MAMSKYLVASCFGALIGACCVLIAVYVTNTKALIIASPDMPEGINSLHSRINDFYIFAGIVITLLLAINVGVYVKANEEIDRQLAEHIKQHDKKLTRLYNAAKDKVETSKINLRKK
jgi:uncharacterized membrane protein